MGYYQNQLNDATKRRKRIGSLYGEDYEEWSLLAFFVQFVPKLLQAEICSVFIHDPKSDDVWLKCSNNISEKKITVPRTGSIVGQVITSGESVIRNDLLQVSGVHTVIGEKTGFVTRNMVCVPIRDPMGSRVIGAVQVINKNIGLHFTEKDLEETEEVSKYLAGIMVNLYLDQEMVEIYEKMARRADYGSLLINLFGAISIFVLIFVALRLSHFFD
ncbi:MAG: GAF domain-containing protein [Magnetococcus sp. DMHC-6]